jgi:hypothetical protein
MSGQASGTTLALTLERVDLYALGAPFRSSPSMTLNQRSSQSWLAKASRYLGKGLAGASLLAAAGGITAGCLQRPVEPAIPQTTNVYISQIRQTGVDKIDLLFMIDNSISMSDKQAILAQAVPVLVQRLITPACVDEDGMPVGGNANEAGICANGVAEFKPIKNIHIGLITSSLGDHGSNDVCSDAQNQANQQSGSTPSFYNDFAQLLPSVRPGLYNDRGGFLVWDPRDQTQVTDKLVPPPTPNETNQATFIDNFTAMVQAAGENGCGYEAQLESWYRFLIDPEPVKTLTNDMSNSVRGPRNDVVLEQRSKFLRHDSLLAVIMLTDENDCSIIDENGRQGWLVGYKGGVGQINWHMPRASSTCTTNPNDPCCRPCSSGPAPNCPANDADPACSMGDTLSLNEDSMNERCFTQVKRFGIDLLYPTNRYVEGLSKKLIRPRDGGPELPNPIYQPGAKGEPAREPGLVFLAGLVGVPWQDVSTEASWNGRGLEYLTANEIKDLGRWDVILGNPATGINPTDPLMIESIDPRPPGTPHPLIQGVSVVAPGANGGNDINGREMAVTPVRDDLQFACIFDLDPPKDPAQCDANSDGCDCNADEFDKMSPLCQGVTATASGTQIKAKGYPGVRELQVLKDYGANSIVASICPKNVRAAMGSTPQTDPSYGYNPAVAAIVDRLKEALTVKCLPRPLTVGKLCAEGETGSNCVAEADVGKVPCAVVEVRPMVDGVCPDPMCTQPGRSMLEGVPEREKIIPAAREYLRNEGQCGAHAEPCENYCFCELEQFTDEELRACQTGNESQEQAGYCYVDPEATRRLTPDDAELIAGQETLVKDCASTQRRILRFIGENVPAKDGLAFIACIGAAANE